MQLNHSFPLSALPSGRAGSTVQAGCLVIEGGAFRGMYNQGVLDALMRNDINLHTVIGVSAGALAGMNYVSGQIGRSARANLGFRNDSRYVGAKALLHCHSILNLDFLFSTYEQYEPLDKARLNADNRHFVAVATDCRTGRPMFYDKSNCSDILTAVKASASMPYISPMVDVDGVPCLDGGCSCKIAYPWALEQNFEKIIVIRTRDRGYRKPLKSHPLVNKVYGHYPEFAQALLTGDGKYNLQCSELLELEQAGRLYVIAPSQPVRVGRMEKNLSKLSELYWLGYHDTLNQLDSIRQYLQD